MNKPITKTDYTPIQLVIPLELTKIIDISDPVYSFNEVMNHMDLNKYFTARNCKLGRPAYDRRTLLRLVLFAFMEEGYNSLRHIEKLCRNDIRFLYLLGNMPAPSHTTIMEFINNELTESLDDIFNDINRYIFQKEDVDLQHVYLDGTKVRANAHRYSWVWKKNCTRTIEKTFEKLTSTIQEINDEVLCYFNVKIGTREKYSIDYVETIMEQFREVASIDPETFVYGKGHRKSKEQKLYEKLQEHHKTLKKNAEKVAIIGEHRGSCSKTDLEATFMRLKKDHMKNEQLLPAYNIQFAICDEYIAEVDVNQYASDMDCFIPLMEAFKKRYGHYPKYPIGDAGYGSYNNYLFCQENGMEKFMKFPMYAKETEDETYRDNPFRSKNFKTDKDGDLICPNGKKFLYQTTVPVRGNKYGRTLEIYECENCEGCKFRDQCHKGKGNRTINLNKELTSFHQEVLDNLNCIHGALLRMNRSIQAEGAFGEMKWNRSYDRFRRRGLKKTKLEIMLIACGFNLHKFHLKKLEKQQAA